MKDERFYRMNLTIKELLEQGKQLDQKGKLDEALAVYLNIINLNPKHKQAYYFYGNCLLKQDNWEAAAAAFRMAIELDPKYASAYHYLAVVLTKQDKIKEAIKASSQAIEFKNDTAVFYQQLAQNLAKQHHFEAAIENYRQAIALNSQLFWSYQGLGETLSKLNRFAEAISAYQSAIEIEPNISVIFQTYLQLGIAQLQVGNIDLAIDCLVEVLEIKPDCSEVFAIQKFWWQLNSWLFKMSSSQLEQLKRAFIKAIDLVPQAKSEYMFWLLTSLGKILIQQGNIQEAISCNRRALYHHLKEVKPEFIANHQLATGAKEPDFLIIGVLKSGTSSLYQYMTQHPQILPALQKELYYFSGKSKADRNSWDWYLSNFIGASDSPSFLTGEATPSYISYPDVDRRVFYSVPNIKLIALLRHPVDRIISQYFYNVERGVEKQSFASAIATELEIFQNVQSLEEIYTAIERNSNNNNKWDSWYIPHSLYFYFVERWLQLFDRQQFLILLTEELKENPTAVMSRVFQFLNLPEFQELQYKQYNRGSYSPRQVDETMRQCLTEFFRPHNQRLANFLGEKFQWN
jgi:tetratricopeptide (TPR) repeat protein